MHQNLYALRVGPECQITPANIVTCDGNEIQWQSSMRYLGVYITQVEFLAVHLITPGKPSIEPSMLYFWIKLAEMPAKKWVLHIMKYKCLPL